MDAVSIRVSAPFIREPFSQHLRDAAAAFPGHSGTVVPASFLTPSPCRAPGTKANVSIKDPFAFLSSPLPAVHLPFPPTSSRPYHPPSPTAPALLFSLDLVISAVLDDGCLMARTQESFRRPQRVIWRAGVCPEGFQALVQAWEVQKVSVPRLVRTRRVCPCALACIMLIILAAWFKGLHVIYPLSSLIPQSNVSL